MEQEREWGRDGLKEMGRVEGWREGERQSGREREEVVCILIRRMTK